MIENARSIRLVKVVQQANARDQSLHGRPMGLAPIPVGAGDSLSIRSGQKPIQAGVNEGRRKFLEQVAKSHDYGIDKEFRCLPGGIP